MKKLFFKFFKLKKKFYEKYLSTCGHIIGKACVAQPTLFLGDGKIEFDNNVTLGFFPSPHFYSGYIHIEARNSDAYIKFGKDTVINNNFVAIAEHKTIIVGERCLIGANVEVLNSDFHHIDILKRRDFNAPCEDIIIGNNVWLGNGVKILKGVTIGDNSVVGAGSIVVKNIPANVVASGVPAKVIREI